MIPKEKCRAGGIATRDNNITLCPLCGNPVKNKHFTTIGQRGGLRSAQTAGTNGNPTMAERGRKGGIKEKKRN